MLPWQVHSQAELKEEQSGSLLDSSLANPYNVSQEMGRSLSVQYSPALPMENSESDEQVRKVAPRKINNQGFSRLTLEESTSIELEKKQIREYLIKNMKMERLKSFVDRRLSASGWRMDMVKLLREEIKDNRSDIVFETLYNKIKDEGKNKIPESVEDECVKHIKEIYESKVDC